MTTFILLAVIVGETYWLYRLNAFNGIIGWATAIGAGIAAFWGQAEAFVRGLVG